VPVLLVGGAGLRTLLDPGGEQRHGALAHLEGAGPKGQAEGGPLGAVYAATRAPER